MRSWAVEISSDRMYRDLFWLLANLGPIALFGMLALLAVPRYRRVAAAGLLMCAVGAGFAAAVFHYNYALVIWVGSRAGRGGRENGATYDGAWQ
jgi:hypothetical protein